MKRKLILVLIVGVVFNTLLFGNAAQQQSQTQAAPTRVWPNFRTIEIVCGTGAASGTDGVMRVFVNYLKKRFPDVNFIVSNDSGGNGSVGWEKVRTGRPDGSIILFDSPNIIATNAFGTYDHVLEEFAIVHNFRVPIENSVIAVTADSKYKTLQDLIDDAKARPNLVSAPIGIGQVLARAIGMERDLGRVTFRKVAGQDDALRLASVLGGVTDFVVLPPAKADPYVKSGQLRYLGYYGNERCKSLPDVPCFKELGYPVNAPDTQGHYPILGPKGLSEDICSVIQGLVKDLCTDEESRELLYRLELGYPAFFPKEESERQLYAMKDFYLMAAGEKEWNF